MNPLDASYRLFRLLICPSRFLLVLFVASLATVLFTPLLLWLGAHEWVQAVYLVGAMILAILMLSLQRQMVLLASRKTIVLSGNANLYISIITTALLLLLALVMAPLGAHPFVDMAAYCRAALLWFSGLAVLLSIGVLIKINLFFAIFFLLAVSGLSGIIETFQVWVENNDPGLYGFALVGLLAWWLNHDRLCRGRLPQPSRFWEGAADRNDKEWLAKFAGLKLLPRLRLGQHKERNWAMMVLESNYYLRDYVLLFLLSAVCLGAVFSVLQWWWGLYASHLTAWALCLLFMPAAMTLISAGNLAANLRRLWLLMPGGRQQHMQFLERQLLKMGVLVVLVGWLPAGVLLALNAESPLWIMAFLFFLGSQIVTLAYLHLLTVTVEGLWLMLGRVCFVYLQFGMIFLCWFSRDPWWSLGFAGASAALCVILRPLVYNHWRDMDMSRLRLLDTYFWSIR